MRSLRLRFPILFSCTLLSLALHAQSRPSADPQTTWQIEPSETTADLRGVHAVGGGVVWASGTNGTVLRSQDSGFEWQQCATPPGAENLDFRGIWAWDDETAIVMSSGPGAASRLFQTTDGCAHWTLVRTNADPKGFWDGIAFSDRQNGFLLGDPVNGSLLLERTADGGRTWTRITAPKLDTAGRGAFAASNSSLALDGPVLGRIFVPWIGTGGPNGALVLNGGIDCGMNMAHTNPAECLKHWDFTQTIVPLTGTPSSGVFSLALGHDPRTHGTSYAVAVGGDYTRPAQAAGTAAWWAGKAWVASTRPPGGYRSAVACEPGTKLCLAVGPNGSDLSTDGGKTWNPVEHAPAGLPKGSEWNALSLPWAVGPGGRIGKLNAGTLHALAAESVQQTRRKP